MTDPTKPTTPPTDPRRLTGVPEIDGDVPPYQKTADELIDGPFKITHRKLEGVVAVGGLSPFSQSMADMARREAAHFPADAVPMTQLIDAAIGWCLDHAGRGLAAELAQDAARHLREAWATRGASKVEPLAWIIDRALYIGAETAIAWAEGQDRRLRRAPDPAAAPAAKVAGCTGDVPPGAEAVETRFVELFYLDGPRIGLRFKGLPDIYVPDTDAHRIAIAVATGNADLETLRYEPGPGGYDLPKAITLELSQAAEGHEDEAYKPELHVALRHLVAAIARTKVLERSLEAYKRARSVVDDGHDRIDRLINGPGSRADRRRESIGDRLPGDQSSANSFNAGQVGWLRGEQMTRSDDMVRAGYPPYYAFLTRHGNTTYLLGDEMLDHAPPPAKLEEGTLAYLPITPKHEPVGGHGIDIGPGPHQLGRRLMTEDDFRTPVEFKLYCIGAETLPQGILPGSWEGHLLKAMAAMASAAVGLRGAQGPAEACDRDCVHARAHRKLREYLLGARGGTTEHMAKAITRALELIGGGSVEPPPTRDDIDYLRRDAGGKGWLNNLWGVSEGTRPRDLLMLALQQGAEARADLATIAGARPSKSLQRVTLDGEVFMLPGDIAAEFLAAADHSPERTLIAVRAAAAMQGRILELEAGIGLAKDELDSAAEEDSIDRRDQAMREANRQLARAL